MRSDAIWHVFTAECCEGGWNMVSTKWTSEAGPTDRHVVGHLGDCSQADAERAAAVMQRTYDRVRAIPIS